MIENNTDVALTAVAENEFSEAQRLLNKSLDLADPNPAFDYITRLRQEMLGKFNATAYMLWSLRRDWKAFVDVGEDQDFFGTASARTGYSESTIRKYIRLHDSLYANDRIPMEIKKAARMLPARAQLLLTAAAREGDLSEEDWERVVMAGTAGEVRDIVREARGQATSSETALLMSVKLSSGSIVCRRGDSRWLPVGNLNTWMGTMDMGGTHSSFTPEEVDIILQACARIIRSSGMGEFEK